MIIPYATGGDPVDFPLIFDYSNQLAGPPQWSAASPLVPEPMPWSGIELALLTPGNARSDVVEQLVKSTDPYWPTPP